MKANPNSRYQRHPIATSFGQRNVLVCTVAWARALAATGAWAIAGTSARALTGTDALAGAGHRKLLNAFGLRGLLTRQERWGLPGRHSKLDGTGPPVSIAMASVGFHRQAFTPKLSCQHFSRKPSNSVAQPTWSAIGSGANYLAHSKHA